MASIPTSNCADVVDKRIVSLNQDIAYLLIKYLKGLDAINFMEAVNGSQQFQAVEITEEYVFYKIFMALIHEQKVVLNVPYLDFYLETGSVDAEGYLYPNQYHGENPPLLRLFIHSVFTAEAFEQLCCTYKTSSFQCHSRLLPFNTHSYVGALVLVDYFNYKSSIGASRELNFHERNLFKGQISRRVQQEKINV